MKERGPPPERLGPYRVLAPIAEGGMGVVYRAQDERTGEIVALKTVIVREAESLGSIRREIQALSRIQHPGVVRILGQGVEAGIPWYAMELLEGETLRRLGRRLGSGATAIFGEEEEAPERGALRPPSGPPPPETPTEVLPEPEAERAGAADARAGPGPRDAKITRRQALLVLNLVRRLCSTLSFLHGEGIVHRDLKPENVVVRPDGTPVLVDFGLVPAGTAHPGRERIDAIGAVIGSIDYMAPEQIRGELTDARTDLYALGCILYELVTGRAPFTGTVRAIASHHLHDPPAPPSRRVRGVPPALDALVLGLLAKRPRDRIGCADDVADALVELGADPAPPGERPPPRPYLYRPGFSGRADVMAALGAHLDRLEAGAGGRVLLGGFSGAGKTRVAIEIARVAARRRMRVITGECLPVRVAEDEAAIPPASRPRRASASVGAPLHPMRPLLQAIADVCHEQGEGATERLLGRRRLVLAPYLPALRDLPSAAHPEPPRLPATAARLRLLGDLAETIAAFAADAPLLLVLDDLQWADELTLGLLARLGGERPAGARALVLGTYRSEQVGEALRDLLAAPGVEHLVLDRLDAASVQAIAADMLSQPAPPPAVAAFLEEHAQGNPFFVAELLRDAVDEGLLRRGRMGRWELAGGEAAAAAASLRLPRSLAAVIGRRLERLRPEARRLVEVAAVLGRELDAPALAKVAAIGEAETFTRVDELLALQILEEAGGGRLRFAHDKLREIAYGAIPDRERRALHRAAGFALEEGATTEAARGLLLSTLAHHFEIAGALDRAAAYLDQAGERALRTGAHAEAAAFVRRALALAERAPADGDARVPMDRARRARWERMLCEAEMGLGDLRRASEHAAAALRALGLEVPHTRAAWLRHVAAEVSKQALHLASSTFGAPGRLTATEDRELGEAVSAAALMALSGYFGGDGLAFFAMSLLAVNLAERAPPTSEVSRAYAHLGYVAGLARVGPLARAYFRRAEALGRAQADPSAIAFALYIQAAYHLGRCDWAQARATAAPALDLLREIGDRQEAEIVETILGHVAYFEGRFEASRQHFARILQSARDRSNVQHEAWGLYAIARCLIPVGRLDEAITLLLEAREILLRQLDRASMIICDGLLATTFLRAGDLRRARETADAVSAFTRGTWPAVFSTVHGYEGAADVYLTLWERAASGAPGWRELGWPSDGAAGAPAPSPTAIFAREARAACSDLQRFAMVFPLALPASLRAAGRGARLSGDARLAEALLERAVRAARDLRMPYEEALALAELGRSPSARDEHRRRAAEIFDALGVAKQG